MTWTVRVAVGLAVSVGGVLAAVGQEPPARPKAKVDLRWVEGKPVKGLTEDTGFQASCYPDGIAYPHKKPALMLTPAHVAEARLSSVDFSGSLGKQYRVTLHLTKEARAQLAAACAGERVRQLTVVVDGKCWGVSRYETDAGAGVPPDVRAETFTPGVGFFASKAEAERLVDAFDERKPLAGDALRVVEVKPASPAVLKVGDKMEVRFAYSLESAELAVILVHPTTTSKYTPHPLPGHKKGQGEGVGWFVFNGPASIEEVQLRMVDNKGQKKLVVKHPVKAEWK